MCWLDGFDFGHTGDLLFEHTLDSVLQRHRRHRTSIACSLKSYTDDPFFGHFHEFDIATISLECRPDILECVLYIFLVHHSLHKRLAPPVLRRCQKPQYPCLVGSSGDQSDPTTG